MEQGQLASDFICLVFLFLRNFVFNGNNPIPLIFVSEVKPSEPSLKKDLHIVLTFANSQMPKIFPLLFEYSLMSLEGQISQEIFDL